MKKLSESQIRELLKAKPYSVIHIDADWDLYRHQVWNQIDSILKEFDKDVSFGYVDCDDEQEYAKEIKVMNTPSVAYYRGEKLMAVVIGLGQDLAENIRIVMAGEELDTSNGLSRF
jgi:hypothetical protein